MATITSLDNFIAFQLAQEFRQEVYRLVRECRCAIDFKYQSQLLDAADGIEANLAEGYKRNNSGEFAQFARYAASSLAEACVRLQQGFDRGYFTAADCSQALSIGKRADNAIRALQ